MFHFVPLHSILRRRLSDSSSDVYLSLIQTAVLHLRSLREKKKAWKGIFIFLLTGISSWSLTSDPREHFLSACHWVELRVSPSVSQKLRFLDSFSQKKAIFRKFQQSTIVICRCCPARTHTPTRTHTHLPSGGKGCTEIVWKYESWGSEVTAIFGHSLQPLFLSYSNPSIPLVTVVRCTIACRPLLQLSCAVILQQDKCIAMCEHVFLTKSTYSAPFPK